VPRPDVAQSGTDTGVYNFYVCEFSVFTVVHLTSLCLCDMVLCDCMIGAGHFENIQR